METRPDTTPGARRPLRLRFPLHRLPVPAGYALAVLVPAAVTAYVRVVDDPDYRLGPAFVAAVAIVALAAGPIPALVATAVAFAGFWYTVVPPVNQFAVHLPSGLLSLATFLLSAVAIIAVVRQRDATLARFTTSQQRYRRLADIGVIGIMSWDITGPITGANDAFLQMMGFTREDLTSGLVDWKLLTPPEYAAVDAEKVAELARDGFHEPYEKEYLRADGTRVPVLLGSAFLEGSDRTGVSFVLDISERWQLAAEREAMLDTEREVARIMQRALLPDSHPAIDGHEVSTCYVPAAAGREIGGDWWEVLPLPGGLTGIVVGDVSGHDVRVAPTMAKLRHSINGVLVHGAGPAAAAAAASQLLEVARPETFATAFVAVYDPATRELTYSRAGHPAPLLVTADAVVELAEPGGTLLGLQVGERRQSSVVLPEEFELVAFTDGLIEAPGLPYDDGVGRLAGAVRSLPVGLTGPARAQWLVGDVLGGTARDDVCVVMIRRRHADVDPAAATSPEVATA